MILDDYEPPVLSFKLPSIYTVFLQRLAGGGSREEFIHSSLRWKIWEFKPLFAIHSKIKFMYRSRLPSFTRKLRKTWSKAKSSNKRRTSKSLMMSSEMSKNFWEKQLPWWWRNSIKICLFMDVFLQLFRLRKRCRAKF